MPDSSGSAAFLQNTGLTAALARCKSVTQLAQQMRTAADRHRLPATDALPDFGKPDTDDPLNPEAALTAAARTGLITVPVLLPGYDAAVFGVLLKNPSVAAYFEDAASE